jgi:deoxyribonuclease-2
MKITALDESGKAVDWFFLYKVPKLVDGANTDKTTGYEYVYYDSTIDQLAPNKRIIDKSPYLLNSDKGALNQTLDSVFNNPDATTGWILYNDERPGDIPGKDNGALGHTKGVLAFDAKSKTGYWLLHSWPKFAEPKAKADPTPMYGQTYLCLSLDFATLEQIAGQMISHQEPQTYLNRTDCFKEDQSSPLYKLAGVIDANAAGNSNVLRNLKTVGGTQFMVIAKNRAWNQDFWNGLVGPTLGEDMDVDTWIRGAVAPVSDTDGIHKTYDIKYINLGPLGIHMAWPETHDHAKWGITTHSNWVCVGDINRMISQRKRGGGTIAFQNQALWQGLSKTDLLLAPPGLTRNQARSLVHATHYDPTDQHGSSPASKIHTMANVPRKGASYRGKTMPALKVPKNPIELSPAIRKPVKRAKSKK